MILDARSIYTYMDCPIKYALMYNTKFKPGEKSMAEKFSEAMHTTLYYFWFKMMNDGRVTDVELIKKWESIWYDGNGISAEDIMYYKKKDLVDLGNKGTAMIQGFIRTNKNNPGYPIAVNMDFAVPIGDHHITGRFELVREINRALEIVDYKTSMSIPDRVIVDRDIALTMQSYAFRHMFQKNENLLTYHYLRQNKPISTRRTRHDYDRLAETINAIAHCIEHKIYYPRDTFKCGSCEYKNHCGEWPLQQES